MPKKPLVWPDGIDPLISNNALFTAIACRSDACIIAMMRNLGSQGVTETPYYYNGNALQCLGLTTVLQSDILNDLREQGDDQP